MTEGLNRLILLVKMQGGICPRAALTKKVKNFWKSVDIQLLLDEGAQLGLLHTIKASGGEEGGPSTEYVITAESILKLGYIPSPSSPSPKFIHSLVTTYLLLDNYINSLNQKEVTSKELLKDTPPQPTVDIPQTTSHGTMDRPKT